jgi:hypothetical protein
VRLGVDLLAVHVPEEMVREWGHGERKIRGIGVMSRGSRNGRKRTDETWLGTNTVEVDSSEILTKHLLEMLGELKGE